MNSGGRGRSRGGDSTAAGTAECDEVDDWKGSEASVKSFAIKVSMSEIVSLREDIYHKISS